MKTINFVSYIKNGIIALLGSLFLLVGCDKDNGSTTGGLDVTGEWELVSCSSLTDNQMHIKVYIKFDATAGSFTIYQKLGEGHFRQLNGTYTMSDSVMSGKYSDGVAFDCNWEVCIENDTLTMKSFGNENANETNVYKRCTIPDDVIKDASDYYPTIKSIGDFRPL